MNWFSLITYFPHEKKLGEEFRVKIRKDFTWDWFHNNAMACIRYEGVPRGCAVLPMLPVLKTTGSKILKSYENPLYFSVISCAFLIIPCAPPVSPLYAFLVYSAIPCQPFYTYPVCHCKTLPIPVRPLPTVSHCVPLYMPMTHTVRFKLLTKVNK